ncbi:MAG: sigma-70 family RNA polymerase sigma factor [Bacteroides sp.]|nr:sigma-70 family RNA polymerase sigma factor [Bacteroides sp.]
MDNKRLVEQCRMGDEQAFSQLYQDYYDELMKVCLYYVPDRQIAQDLLHDSFIIIFTSIRSLRDPDRLDSWMKMIVKNLCLKYINQSNAFRMMPLSEVEEAEEPIDIPYTETSLSYAALVKLIEQLPDGYQKIFRLSVLEGMSHKEIGILLGIAPHSSSSQLFRAKEMLKKLIMRYGIITCLLLAALLSGVWWLMPSGDSIGSEVVGKQFVEQAEEPCKTPKLKADSVIERTTPLPPRLVDNKREYFSDASIVDSLPSSSVEKDTDTVSSPAKDKQEKIPYRRILNANPPDAHYANVLSPKKRTKQSLSVAYSGGEEYTDSRRFTTSGGDMSSELPQVVEEQVHHYMPITFSLTLHRNIGERWGIETGVRYTLLRSDFTTRREYLSESVQRIGYLGIPLKGTFQIWERGKLSVYVGAGMALEIPIKATVEEARTENGVTATHDERLSLPLGWSAGFGVGLEYRLTPSIGIYAEPGIRYYFKNKRSPNTLWTQRPLDVSLPIGIRFSW